MVHHSATQALLCSQKSLSLNALSTAQCISSTLCLWAGWMDIYYRSVFSLNSSPRLKFQTWRVSPWKRFTICETAQVAKTSRGKKTADWIIFLRNRLMLSYIVLPASGLRPFFNESWNGFDKYTKHGVGTCSLDAENGKSIEWPFTKWPSIYVKFHSQSSLWNPCDTITLWFKQSAWALEVVQWFPHLMLSLIC